MIDFDGGMDFIESERDNKHKTTTSDCICVFKFTYWLEKLVEDNYGSFVPLIVFGSKRFGVCVYRTRGHKEMPFTTNLFITIS